MDKIDDILKYKKSTPSYYDILGCCRTSSKEQIHCEYRVKALLLHPDKNLDDPTKVDEFRKIQQAKDILLDDTKRKEYDKWLDSGIAIEFDRWLSSLKSHSIHWAKPIPTNQMLSHTCNSPSVKEQRFIKPVDLRSKFRTYEI